MGKLLKVGGPGCLGLIMLVVALLSPHSHPAAAQAECTFKLGFKALHDQIPDIVGDCIGDEYWNDVGDSNQITSRGLLAWRKVDNWTAFTDGSTTWLMGPEGVVSRPNAGPFFSWEGVVPAPPAPPAPAPPPPPPAQPIPPAPRTVAPTATPLPVPTPRPPTAAPTSRPQSSGCCRVCTTGKACGNSCINASYTCRQPSGCACNGLDFKREELLGMLPALFEDANWLKLMDQSSTLPCPDVAQHDGIANDQETDDLDVQGVMANVVKPAP